MYLRMSDWKGSRLQRLQKQLNGRAAFGAIGCVVGMLLLYNWFITFCTIRARSLCCEYYRIRSVRRGASRTKAPIHIIEPQIITANGKKRQMLALLHSLCCWPFEWNRAEVTRMERIDVVELHNSDLASQIEARMKRREESGILQIDVDLELRSIQPCIWAIAFLLADSRHH